MLCKCVEANGSVATAVANIGNHSSFKIKLRLLVDSRQSISIDTATVHRSPSAHKIHTKLSSNNDKDTRNKREMNKKKKRTHTTRESRKENHLSIDRAFRGPFKAATKVSLRLPISIRIEWATRKRYVFSIAITSS